ncbi:MAG: lipid A biosynthesis acyltransferase [Chloroherpetonaceae bacterium]|nr:lipid A biosynthesis acyltransferase [Chloroherpetonaceae bacterium]MDW8438462.1 lipid A biosynthesis acyltransferase [Chloroherpetonaceae bacterium]
MKRFLKIIADALIYAAFMAMGAIARRLTIERVYRLGEIVGVWLYERLKLRRKLVETNLRLSFPEKSEEERARIARQVYIEQAQSLLEIMRAPLIRSKADAEKIFEVKNMSLAERLCAEGKGAVVVSAHFGNWELKAMCWAFLAKPCVIVYKPFSNKFLDKKMLEWRTLGGNEFISMSDAPKLGLKRLREGKFLALLSDQAAHGDDYFTNFLGREAAIFLGAAVFALRTKLPVILSMSRRIGVGKHLLELSEIKTDDLTSFSAENVRILAERYTRAIEDYVCRYPEQWFWLHNRWKRSPPQKTVATASEQTATV